MIIANIVEEYKIISYIGLLIMFISPKIHWVIKQFLINNVVKIFHNVIPLSSVSLRISHILAWTESLQGRNSVFICSS